MKFMQKIFKSDKKGFTLMELLVVIVLMSVLAITVIGGVSRYIIKGKEQKEVQTKKNIALAAELYVQANRDMLPKEIGETSYVKVSELKESNYFKENITDEAGNDCIEYSYVRVFKFSEDEYSYTTVLQCGEGEIGGHDDIESPYLDPAKIVFSSEDGFSTKDVKNAYFTFTLKGGREAGVKLYSYSYSILVKTGDDTELVEVYNSGNIDAKQQEKVTVESKSLSEYFDFTGESVVYVKVRAINTLGGDLDYIQEVTDEDDGKVSFNDTQKPYCAGVQNGAKDNNDWINKTTFHSGYDSGGGDHNSSKRHYPAQIQVKCDDKLGSGCQRELFTKSWPSNSLSDSGRVDYRYGVRWAYLTIYDNAVNSNEEHKANERKCYVRVNVDIQAPHISLIFYGTNKNGSKREVYRTEISDQSNMDNVTPNPIRVSVPATAYANAFSYDQNGLSWLNNEYYYYNQYNSGLLIEAFIEDNLYLSSYSWETNDPLLPRDTADSALSQSASTDNALLDIMNNSGTMYTYTYAYPNYNASTLEKVSTQANVMKGTFVNKYDTDVDIASKNNDDTAEAWQTQQFYAMEMGAKKAEIKYMRLSIEGRRYGRLTVEDKAGNKSIIEIYANLDFTPPDPPILEYYKNGVVVNGETRLEASHDEYEPATNSNYSKDNKADCGHETCRWSKEQIMITLDEDNQVDLKNKYDPEVESELSGAYNFVVQVRYQNTDRAKYQFLSATADTTYDSRNNPFSQILIEREGVHQIKSYGCDNAGNCSDNYDDAYKYVKIDYTKPICPIKYEFGGSPKPSYFHIFKDSNDTSVLSSEVWDSNGNISTTGWLKGGESVTLYHNCFDNNSYNYTNVKNYLNSSNKISVTQSGCDNTHAYNLQRMTYNTDIDTPRAGTNGYYNSNTDSNVYSTLNDSSLGDDTLGGHVIDIAGNISEPCPVRELKIDTVSPTCQTIIAYPNGNPLVDGQNDSCNGTFDITFQGTVGGYSGLRFSKDYCDGWLGLLHGGNGYPITSANYSYESPSTAHTSNGETVTKKVAIVAQTCEDNPSQSGAMTGVHSDCNVQELNKQYTVYNFEVQTDSAGALGIGLGGHTYDNAGNMSPLCPADKTIYSDYSVPVCTTTITYPEGNPINPEGDSIESGWLGYADNDSGEITQCLDENGNVVSSGSSFSTNATVTFEQKAYKLPSENDYGNELSRAAFAKLLIDAVGVDINQFKIKTNSDIAAYFKDVTTSTPNWKYIMAARLKGYFFGYDEADGTYFKPSQTINRAEMITALMRAVRMNTNFTLGNNCMNTPISNEYTKDDWYAEDFTEAIHKCILEGYEDGSFRPEGKASVVEGVVVIYRALRRPSSLGLKCTDKTNNNPNLSSSHWAYQEAKYAVNSHTCQASSNASSSPGSDPGSSDISPCDTSTGYVPPNGGQDSVTHSAYISYSSSDPTYPYEGHLTRAEYAKMLLDSMGTSGSYSGYYNKYSDVTSSTLYASYIMKGTQLGYFEGHGDGTFGPYDFLTRAQLVEAVMKVYKIKGLDTGKTCNGNPPDVQDGMWYTTSMRQAASLCLLVGDDQGMYHPEEYATRAEVIAVLNRAFRSHDNMSCRYTTNRMYTNVLKTYWAYDYIKEAVNDHVCTPGYADGDGSLQGNTGTTFEDTMQDKISYTKKTAVISQKCDDMGTYNSSLGFEGSISGCDTVNHPLQQKVYNSNMDHNHVGAISVNDNGMVYDIAGNKGDCNADEANFHWVRIDYNRPVCEVSSSYFQIIHEISSSGKVSMSSKFGNSSPSNLLAYDGHWMGEGSYVEIHSECDPDEDDFINSSYYWSHDSVGDYVNSGCWSSKNSTYNFHEEVKTNAATSKGYNKNVYVYDYAGNRSLEACEKQIVQIDTTGPVCDVAGVHGYENETTESMVNTPARLYFASTGLIYNGESQTATIGYHNNNASSKWQADGWLNGQYEVRVVSECNVDQPLTNFRVCTTSNCPRNTGDFDITDATGTGCYSGSYYDTIKPTGKKHQQQRSAVYKKIPNQVFDRKVGSLDEPQVAKNLHYIKTSKSYDFYDPSYIPVSNATYNLTRGQFATLIVAALQNTYDANNKPFINCSTVSSSIHYADIDMASGDISFINTTTSMKNAIECATAYGFFEGRGDNRFEPNDIMPRSEMIVAGVRVGRNMGYAYDDVVTDAQLSADVNKYTQKWYYEEIKFAVQKGLIEGDASQVWPDRPATRAEAITYLNRVLQRECSDSSHRYNYYTGSGWAKPDLNIALSDYTCDRAPNSTSAVYDHVGNSTTCEKIQVKIDDEKPTCTNKVLLDGRNGTENGTSSGSIKGNGNYWWSGGNRDNTEIYAYSYCDDKKGSGCDTRTNVSYSITVPKDKDDSISVDTVVPFASWKLSESTGENANKTATGRRSSKANGITYGTVGGQKEGVVIFRYVTSLTAPNSTLNGQKNATITVAQRGTNGWVKDAVDNAASCDGPNKVDILSNYGIDYIAPHCKTFSPVNIYTDQPKWEIGRGSLHGDCTDDKPIGDTAYNFQSGCASNSPETKYFGSSGTVETNGWQLYYYKDVPVKDIVGNTSSCSDNNGYYVRIDNQKPTGTCTFSARYTAESDTNWTNYLTMAVTVTGDGEGSSSATHGTNSVQYSYSIGSASKSGSLAIGGSVGPDAYTAAMACGNSYSGSVKLTDQVGNSTTITCSGSSITTPACCSWTRYDGYSKCSMPCGYNSYSDTSYSPTRYKIYTSRYSETECTNLREYESCNTTVDCCSSASVSCTTCSWDSTCYGTCGTGYKYGDTTCHTVGADSGRCSDDYDDWCYTTCTLDPCPTPAPSSSSKSFIFNNMFNFLGL